MQRILEQPEDFESRGQVECIFMPFGAWDTLGNSEWDF